MAWDLRIIQFMQKWKGFASFTILCSVSFYLGIVFSNWFADYNVLWKNPLPENAFADAERHYLLMAQGPKALRNLLHGIMMLGLFAHVVRIFTMTNSTSSYDCASLVLYMAAVIVYGSNVVPGILSIRNKQYGDLQPLEHCRVLSASQVILAVILFGILLLHYGQHFTDIVERDDLLAEQSQNAAQTKGAKVAKTSKSKAQASSAKKSD